MTRVAVLSVALMLASCKSCDDPPKSSADATTAESATDAPAPSDTGDSSREAASPIDAAVADEPFAEAGTSSCRLAYGPAEQPFRGPAAMLVAGQELRLIANDAGKPRLYSVPIAPVVKSAPAAVPRPASFVGMRWPPCEIAGRFVYCQGPGGATARATMAASGTFSDPKSVVSRSRAGTRIAAASLGADHSVVAYLDTRRTTEGDVIQAFITLDDKEAVRLSDDGAGATTLRFIPRGEGAVAVYLDTRSAMVPIHARPVSLRGTSELALGDDSVVHVGGAPERGIDFAVAPAKGNAFVFVPMPQGTTDFGMATIVVEDPIKEDVPATWSLYPNGLDPAPLAAAGARDGKSVWIVRARPREKALGSPRILELGRVMTESGASVFTSYGEIAPGKAVTDIALVEDGSGAVWILYGDATITWLERRVCT